MDNENLIPEEEIVTELEINELCCSKCGCTNIVPVKKGFSGRNAVIGYIVASVVGAIILAWAYDQNDFLTIYRSYAFVGVIVLLSFFTGTVDMNALYAVCLRCGNKLLVKSEEEKAKTSWWAANPND